MKPILILVGTVLVTLLFFPAGRKWVAWFVTTPLLSFLGFMFLPAKEIVGAHYRFTKNLLLPRSAIFPTLRSSQTVKPD
jgi:hypothetical protein